MGVVLSAKVAGAGVGDVRGVAMDTDAARTRDLIGSALLFAFAILINLPVCLFVLLLMQCRSQNAL